MASTTEVEAAATSAAASPNDEEGKEIQNDTPSTFLEAVMTQQVEEAPDIENQQQQPLPATNHSIGILASRNIPNKEHGQDEDGNSSTDSLFSFDSYEIKGIPPKSQSVLHNNNNTTTSGASTTVPFPSVIATSIERTPNNTSLPIAHNACPCQCLFFTVKESICLVVSALGCAVFLAGLIVLCLYLEGTLFEREGV